jgi:hypothetical protein
MPDAGVIHCGLLPSRRGDSKYANMPETPKQLFYVVQNPPERY